MRSLQMMVMALLLAAGAPAAQEVAGARAMEPVAEAAAGEAVAASTVLESSTSTAQVPAPAAAEQSTELGRFIYNVAVGVAVAVLSTLILRAIL